MRSTFKVLFYVKSSRASGKSHFIKDFIFCFKASRWEADVPYSTITTTPSLFITAVRG